MSWNRKTEYRQLNEDENLYENCIKILLQDSIFDIKNLAEIWTTELNSVGYSCL